MNIVLLGSCLDSSNLAKELNKKMKNSVVFRIDLLKNLKNIIPFSAINSSVAGEYLGDIEKIDFSRVSDTEKDIVKAFQSSVKLIEDNPSLSNALSATKAYNPSIERVTRNFDSLTLTLVRVVSGIQTVRSLARYLSGNNPAIVVYLDTPNIPLFEREITKEQYLEIKNSKAYVNHLFLTSTDLNTLLADEVFNLLLNPKVEKEGKIVKLEAVEEKTSEVQRTITQRVGGGILAQLQHVGTPGIHRNPLTVTMLDNFVTEHLAAAA